MTFTKLKCPNTPLYQDTKKFILTGDFAWYYKPTTVVGTEGMDEYNLDGWYSHELLSRPKFGTIGNAYFPTVGSEQFTNIYPMVHEILEFNNVPVNCIYRVNANCTHPSIKPTQMGAVGTCRKSRNRSNCQTRHLTLPKTQNTRWSSTHLVFRNFS